MTVLGCGRGGGGCQAGSWGGCSALPAGAVDRRGEVGDGTAGQWPAARTLVGSGL